MATKSYKNIVPSLIEKGREAKNRFADKMISTGMALQADLIEGDGMFRNTRAEGTVKGILILIVSAVVAIKLTANMLPSASQDWAYATDNASGGMYSASASDKSTWKTGGSLIPIVGLMIIAGFAIRSLGN